MPATPAPQLVDSVPLSESATAPEVHLDLPIANGPFEPTWESIEKHYPGTPEWLREAKFGIWVHFGPQSAGQSGDWYARHLYKPQHHAYQNHLKNYGHPSEVGYKEVLRDWNPDKLDPTKLIDVYKNAGARFLIIQGVHHDNFDMWDSHYQPWNSVRLGPKRDLLGEWSNAARNAGIHFGVTFHHEYTWWWWQTAFGADKDGPKAGVPYDGHLTLADGKGQWWEGLDPRMLYGIDLREYEGVTHAANSAWSPPSAGLFSRHAAYAQWYATWWAMRMMDVIEKYDPDFIYTDGTGPQPFSGDHTGTGIKADAMQRVIAHYYNRTLERRGEVDTFSIVKFRPRTSGTVTTEEFGVPHEIKTDQPWIAEIPVGDWFYAPDFIYDSGMIIRYIIEAVARDGNAGVCISLRPDGSLDDACADMLKEVGQWMRRNGAGIYGSHAWIVPGEGEMHDGKLKMLPGGKLHKRHADFRFGPQDFRFTVGKDGGLYAFCMTVPEPGARLAIRSLGKDSGMLAEPIASVKLLGHNGVLQWSQDDEALRITYPNAMPANTAICFKIGPASIIKPIAPTDLVAAPKAGAIDLHWNATGSAATYTVKRAASSAGPYTPIAADLIGTSFTDKSVQPDTPYYYTVSTTIGSHASPDATPVPCILAGPVTWASQDIGMVGKSGSVIQSGDNLLASGSGADIWYNADAFHYTYKTLRGNGSITTRVESLQDTAPWAKAGVMIRESLDADSPQAIAFVSPTQGIAFQGRTTKGGVTSGFADVAEATAPHWLRLERRGNTFTAYHSLDSRTWTPLGATTIRMVDEVHFGLAVCSVRHGTLCQAMFSHVMVTK